MTNKKVSDTAKHRSILQLDVSLHTNSRQLNPDFIWLSEAQRPWKTREYGGFQYWNEVDTETGDGRFSTGERTWKPVKMQSHGDPLVLVYALS